MCPTVGKRFYSYAYRVLVYTSRRRRLYIIDQIFFQQMCLAGKLKDADKRKNNVFKEKPY